jgi:hypothetical protein
MTEHEKILEMICQKEQMPIALDPRQTALIVVDVQRFSNRPPKGGHFAAWQQPQLFTEDVRATFRSLR